MNTGLLLIAHGSRHAEANADLEFVAAQMRLRGSEIVVAAYLELAEPNIESGGARGSSSSKEASGETSAGATRLRVEGEVKADAPLRVSAEKDSEADAARELPELRNFIRGRRAVLAQRGGLLLQDPPQVSSSVSCQERSRRAHTLCRGQAGVVVPCRDD